MVDHSGLSHASFWQQPHYTIYPTQNCFLFNQVFAFGIKFLFWWKYFCFLEGFVVCGIIDDGLGQLLQAISIRCRCVLVTKIPGCISATPGWTGFDFFCRLLPNL